MTTAVDQAPRLIDRFAMAFAGALIVGLIALLLSFAIGPMPTFVIWSIGFLGVVCVLGGFVWPDKIQDFFIALLKGL